MVNELIRVAQDEAQRLIEELRQHPAYRKLELIQSVIAEYQAKSDLPAVDQETSSASKRVSKPVGSVARMRLGSKASDRILAAQNFLRTHGKRAQTRDILEALESEGIQFEGEQAVYRLASTLSSSPLFDNVRGEGYGLVEWDKTKNGNSQEKIKDKTEEDENLGILPGMENH